MTSSQQVGALHGRLGGHRLGLLFVNAAIDRGNLSWIATGRPSRGHLR